MSTNERDEVLVGFLRQWAEASLQSEDDDGPGVFIPNCCSGDVYDVLTAVADRLARPAAPPADREDKVSDPSWPLFDRVEFALRDAGFDYDEAYALATKATTPPARESAANADAARLDWLLSKVIVDDRGVAIPCGNAKITASDKVVSIRFIDAARATPEE